MFPTVKVFVTEVARHVIWMVFGGIVVETGIGKLLECELAVAQGRKFGRGGCEKKRYLCRRRLFMWPFGSYKFRSYSGGRPTLRTERGQTFIVDVHTLVGHGCE